MGSEFDELYSDLEEVTVNLVEAADNHPNLAFEAFELEEVDEMQRSVSEIEIYRLVPIVSSLWTEVQNYLIENNKIHENHRGEHLSYQEIERALGRLSPQLNERMGYDLVDEPNYQDSVSPPGSPVFEPAE